MAVDKVPGGDRHLGKRYEGPRIFFNLRESNLPACCGNHVVEMENNSGE